MVADDDPAILDAIKMILEFENYDVKTTETGHTILEMKDEYPDLFLLDVWMSGLDGRDICRTIKANPDTEKIPVVMISASKDVAQSVKEAGADDFLPKPFEMEELLSVVGKHVKN